MACPGGSKLSWDDGGEGDTVDVLGEGLAPQEDLLSLPVPHGEHEVRAAPHGG